jgi:ABC-type transport system involved in cytochrome bd biosynthesis fused ATPase/permease subunit
MESRGLSPEPSEVRSLAERSGLDADALLARVDDACHPYHGSIKSLADELELGETERLRLARAFTYDT